MKVPSHMNRTLRARSVIAAAAGAVGLGLLGAGCGDDNGSGSDATTTSDGVPTTSTTRRSTSISTSTTASPTTSTTGSTAASSPEEQEVIDRYIGYWQARTAANTGVPNPSDPALAEFATGEQLAAVVAETQSNLDNGLAFRPAERPANFREVRVVSITGDAAVVQDCRVDDEVVYRRDTGEVVNDTVATHNVRGELTRIDGRWRLARAELVQRWEGVGGCALDG